MADISKEQAIELARAAGVVDGPKILMMATPDELHRLAQAAFKLGRNSGLDAAKNVALEYPKYGEATAEEIESLKDNTPCPTPNKPPAK